MASSHFRTLLLSCTALPIAATLPFSPAWAQGTPSAAPIRASIGVQAVASEDAFQVRFRADTLVLTPVLSVGLVDGGAHGVVGEDVRFAAYSNYPAFITRGEVRIFKVGQSPDAQPLAKINVDSEGRAVWRVPSDLLGSAYFVYRVTGRDGKFDETTPRPLTLVAHNPPNDLDFGPRPTASNFGNVDLAARRTIDLSGFMATVTGQADFASDHVRVSGQAVPIDSNGAFSAQYILPRLGAGMDVVITRRGVVVKSVSQTFTTPPDDWFIVGQGDITLGRSASRGLARDMSGDTLADGQYAIGRAAFYAKGVTQNDIRITASVDTGETSLEDIFSNLDRKDPRQLLRRLNSDQFYPTYGDDSSLLEDAPTQGRFYLRAAKGPSQLVVGNFVTEVSGGELVQLDRGLFGALVDLNSTDVTPFGERRARFTAFASDPGTVPGREEFRGTGGSLYFLKRQDISIGSQRVAIEVRDRETGLILETRPLNEQQDYDFDPFQGRLTLLTPLASALATSSAVRDGSSTGNVPVLVVRYEYTPPLGVLNGTTVGGRGALWVGDRVRIGMTAQRDTVEEAAQTLVSVDILHRIAAGTYVKAELAQSDGPGFGQSNSVDGGLSFTDIVTPGTLATARAWRTELAINIGELTNRSGDFGKMSAFYENYDQGFSSAGRLSPTQSERWGLAGTRPFGVSGLISAKYDYLSADDIGENRVAVLDVSNRYPLGGGALIAKAGLRFDDRTPGLLYNSTQRGRRSDIALELGYAPRATNWEVSGFGQATVSHDPTRARNNRVGLGAKSQITQRLSVESEVSGGDGGFAADIQLNHRRSDNSQSYIGFALSSDRTDIGFEPQNIFTRSNNGTLTLGARHRFSDALSITGENRIGMGGTAPSLTRSFGLQFDPTEKVSITGSFETGKIDDATTGLFRRTAASLALGYTRENFRIGSAIELRVEKGAGRDQRVWLARNNASYAINPNWRAIGQVNIARADNTNTAGSAAQFTEAMAGFAYRPVDNERLNGLFRFQYFDDLGPVGQITGSGQIQSPKQTSTIVSADINYDLTRHLTLGAKYGFREGRVSLTRDSNEFFNANAHLAVLRFDYNFVAQWELLGEARALWVTQARDQRLGALLGVYRHFGNNVKLGVGYSWSDFSDDLTDQSYTSRGPFVNLIGKF